MAIYATKDRKRFFAEQPMDEYLIDKTHFNFNAHMFQKLTQSTHENGGLSPRYALICHCYAALSRQVPSSST